MCSRKATCAAFCAREWIFPTFDESRMSRQRELSPSAARRRDFLLVLIPSTRVSRPCFFGEKRLTRGKRKVARQAKNADAIGVILFLVFLSSFWVLWLHAQAPEAIFNARCSILMLMRRLVRPEATHYLCAAYCRPRYPPCSNARRTTCSSPTPADNTDAILSGLTPAVRPLSTWS